MKKVLVVILGSSFLTGCLDPQSPLFWEPAAEIAHQLDPENKVPGPGAPPASTGESDPSTEIIETETDITTPEPVEVVTVTQVEPTRNDIEEVKEIETGTSVCMQNDILTNDFEVIDPGTRGQIIHRDGKTIFVAGGREFDITNVPAPTTPC